jgi:phosphoribosyl 1,2-cyclic phosphate phosphodiesterase
MNIPEACAVAAAIGSNPTYLTHLTHQVDHAEWDEKLPPGVFLAYDGLRLVL